MATYDPDFTFCAQADVLRAAGKASIATSDIPSDEDVHQFCQEVTGRIRLKTRDSGLEFVPPLAGITDDAQRLELRRACAVGTVYYWRAAIEQRTGKTADANRRKALEAAVDAIFGKGAASGGAIGSGKGGSLADLARKAAGAGVVHSDLDTGQVELPAPPTTPAKASAPFVASRPD